MSNWNEITAGSTSWTGNDINIEGSYNQHVVNLLLQMEGFKSKVYLDHLGILTFGIGQNLENPNSLLAVLDLFELQEGLDEINYQNLRS